MTTIWSSLLDTSKTLESPTERMIRQWLIKNSSIRYEHGAIIVGSSSGDKPPGPSALSVALREMCLTKDLTRVNAEGGVSLENKHEDGKHDDTES